MNGNQSAFRITIGTLTYQVDTASGRHLGAEKDEAVNAAEALRTALQKKVVQHILASSFPAYAIEIDVQGIRSGSVLVDLAVVVDLLVVAATGTALYKFVKDYPALRKGIVAIAKDLDFVARKHWLILRRKYKTRQLRESFLSEEEIESMVQSVEEEIARHADAAATQAEKVIEKLRR